MNKEQWFELLKKQADKYPKMKVQDMVKFIYQHEFAGGHLIKNKQDSLERVETETTGLRASSTNNQLAVEFEPIGNNLSRMHFLKLVTDNHSKQLLTLNTINEMFVETANSVTGELKAFERKLNLFKESCESNDLPFSLAEVEDYLADYKNRGYPLVRHSEVFRKMYAPSYRLVRDEYRHYFELFRKIDQLLHTKGNIRVAIDGNSVSGKSSLAKLIGEIYDCNIIQMDDYFLQPHQRNEKRLTEAGGNIDYERFSQEILENLNEKQLQYQPYNCKTQSLEEPISLQLKPLTVIEGVYSLHPKFGSYYDLSVCLTLTPEQQSDRILERNGPVMHQRFIDEWIPMEQKYFGEKSIIDKADLVFSGYVAHHN